MRDVAAHTSGGRRACEPDVRRTATHVRRTCEAGAARVLLRATHVGGTCGARGTYVRAPTPPARRTWRPTRARLDPWPLGWTRPLGQPTLPTLLRDAVFRRFQTCTSASQVSSEASSLSKQILLFLLKIFLKKRVLRLCESTLFQLCTICEDLVQASVILKKKSPGRNGRHQPVPPTKRTPHANVTTPLQL